MNLARHQLFTDTRRTTHQHRRVGGRHPLQVRQQLRVTALVPIKLCCIAISGSAP